MVINIKKVGSLKKPRIKDLRHFVQLYIEPNPPTVKWKKMKYLGVADGKKRIIYLNPTIPLKGSYGIYIGNGYLYKSKVKSRLRLSGGEQYFLILLHEIGHFTINTTPPEEYISVRKKLRKMHPKDLQMQSLAAEKYFKRKKNEREKDYLGRLEGFRTWLICGDYIIGHIVVEEWAVREFKKQRKRIKEILKHD